MFSPLSFLLLFIFLFFFENNFFHDHRINDDCWPEKGIEKVGTRARYSSYKVQQRYGFGVCYSHCVTVVPVNPVSACTQWVIVVILFSPQNDTRYSPSEFGHYFSIIPIRPFSPITPLNFERIQSIYGKRTLVFLLLLFFFCVCKCLG